MKINILQKIGGTCIPVYINFTLWPSWWDDNLYTISKCYMWLTQPPTNVGSLGWMMSLGVKFDRSTSSGYCAMCIARCLQCCTKCHTGRADLIIRGLGIRISHMKKSHNLMIIYLYFIMNVTSFHNA